jgi:hypothetical protein
MTFEEMMEVFYQEVTMGHTCFGQFKFPVQLGTIVCSRLQEGYTEKDLEDDEPEDKAAIGDFFYNTNDSEEALDWFHESIPISFLEAFSIYTVPNYYCLNKDTTWMPFNWDEYLS